MCVLAFAWQADPRWRLIMIGNRDERHARPAAALARWDEHPYVLAGRDLEAGGSWLGVSEQGRFAVVTNVAHPDGPQPGKASRGSLIADFLTGDGRYASPEECNLSDFNRFNLIVADAGGARMATNAPSPIGHALPPGVIGLSNSTYDDPWPKVGRITGMLQDWIDTSENDPQLLLDALRQDDSPQVEPQRAAASPIFIMNPVYGTRCSTVVLVDAEGQGRIVERRYDSDGDAIGETELTFRWPV